MILLEHVSKSYPNLPVLKDVSLDLAAGERLCVLGSSGAGKTTLLRLIAGLEVPDTGRVLIGGRLATTQRIHIPPQARNVGMVFQSLALWPHMTARQNIEFVLAGKNRRERRKRTSHLLASVRLTGREDAYPSQLSGGQQQRLAIARTLATDPQILLLDEPLTSLDSDLRKEMADLLRTLTDRFGITVVCASQQPEAVRVFTNRLAMIRDGHLEILEPG